MSNSLNTTPTSSTKTKSVWKSLLHWTLRLVALISVMVLLAWSALHFFIFPRIDDYRGFVQKQASHAIGMRVDIGAIRVQGGWLAPEFEATDIRLFDHEGQETLGLPRVLAVISPHSILLGEFEQLVIDRPELEVRRDPKGRIWVAGFDTSVAGNGSGADWFFSQPEFEIHQGVVHWRDESQANVTPTHVLTLRDIDVSIQNKWSRHTFTVQATPAESLGQRLSLRGKFHQWPGTRAGDLSQWSGEVTADLPLVDFAVLRQWVSMDNGVALREGRGLVRLVADVKKGRPIGVTADVALDAVDVSLGADLPPLILRHVHGRIGMQSADGGVEISSQDLEFETQDGEHWPGGVFRLSWKGDDFASGTLHADRLDLDALAQVGQRVPLPKPFRDLLVRVQPKGQVNQLRVNWQKNKDRALSYSAHGQVQGLSFQRDDLPESPLANMPGLHGAQLEFDVTQKGGKAHVQFSNGSLTLPIGLDEPRIQLKEASTQLAWQLEGDAVAVQFTQGRVLNDDLAGEFSGHWKTGEGATRLPGVLDLTATISHAQVNKVYRYLPNTLPLSVRTYVRDAVQMGEANATLRLRGNLDDMPFEKPELGEFRVAVQVMRGKYAYVPPTPTSSKGTPQPAWPALVGLNGELVIDRAAMHFDGRTQLEGAPKVVWQKVEAHIPNLGNPVVSVTGEASGPLQQILNMVANSSLNDLTDSFLSKSQAVGNAGYKLALSVPLDDLKNTKVQGRVVFANNTLQLAPSTPVLQRVKGVLQFSETDLQISGLKAQLLGGNVSVAGGLSFVTNDARPPVQLKVAGELTAAGLRQAQELGLISRLGQHVSGKLAYTASLGLRRGQPELTVTSDLKGMALSLPAPLNKVAQTALPLRIESSLTRESLKPKSRVLQDQIKLTLGPLVAVTYVRDLSGSKVRVLRGNIAVGPSAVSAPPLRDNAVGLNLQLPMLDLDAWGAVVSQVTQAPLIKVKADPKSTADREATDDAVQEYIPAFATLQANQIQVAERLIHQVLVGGSRHGNMWRLTINAKELNGFAEVRPPQDSTPAQLYVRLADLHIPPASEPDLNRMLSEKPTSIPALDIVVADLTLGDKKLGRLEVNAINQVSPNAVREWRLNKLNLSLPGAATFSANGRWLVDGERFRRTQLKYVFDIQDSGQLLERLGMPGLMSQGKGRLAGDVSWQGSPMSLDYASMSGEMNLAIQQGQFLKVELGAARLLSLINLDFTDLFGDGFAFDSIGGDVRINQGIASTNNLEMKGPLASASIKGSTDLANETQKLQVMVMPEISAGATSLYVAAVNPLAGLVSYIFQLFFDKRLERAGSIDFLVDGTWTKPQVTKVN